MPPKHVEAEEQDEPLTAVLLADSFTSRMRLIASERPKALLPLCNSFLLNYTLEWLEANDVRVVYVLCCSHADQIRNYLTRSPKWAHSGGGMELRVVTSYNCTSVGEAMRLLDNREVIKDDFILVSADTVTNMRIAPALAAHRARRAKDKNSIMTIVMNEGVDEKHRLRYGINDLAICMDPATNKLLSYFDRNHSADNPSAVSIDATFFAERDELAVRTDLQDTEIYVCAPEVLLLYADNWDFQHMRRDFIAGVLSEEELGNKLFVYVLENEYAQRVHNFRAYDAVTRDVLLRWVHPIVPDSNLLPPALADEYGDSQYFFTPGYRYKESGVVTARSGEVGPATCIAAGTSMGERSRVTGSVVGRGCTIGNDCVIQHSFLMAGVTVCDGARISHAFVCDDVTIGARAVLEPGSIIGYNCVIGAGHTVPSYMRITLCQTGGETSEDSDAETEAHIPSASRPADSSDDEDERGAATGPTDAVAAAARAVAAGQPSPVQFDAAVVGAQGAGFAYVGARGAAPSGAPCTPVEQLLSIWLPPAEVAADRVALLAALSAGAQGSDGDGPSDDEDGDVGGGEDDPEAVFKREVAETLLRCMLLARTSGSPEELHENAVIELNSLKIAEVRTFADCARYVLTTILSLALPPAEHVPAQYADLFASAAPDVKTQPGQLALLSALKANLSAWSSTLRRFLHEEEDQIELLLTLEEYCAREGVYAEEEGHLYTTIVSHILMLLYEEEIILENAFVTWEEEKQGDDDEDKGFLKMATKFLTWLKEAEEGTSSDEDSDESE